MQRRNRGKSSQRLKKSVRQTLEKESDDDMDEHEAAVGLQASINAIHTEIKAIRSDVRTELSNFQDALSKDLKGDLANFREDVNRKLTEIATDMKDTVGRVEETEQRVADMEEWSTEAMEALSQALNAQENLQAKLTDLEARSRRNNIRLYGVPEGAEGDNTEEFIGGFIKAELAPADTELGIQRCHRALGSRPPPGANPRSIVIYFLQYKTKELVLRAAWKKKEVYLNGKRIYFDHDYPTETQKKRMAYAPVRKLLKEKGLRFQTPPPAKLRVFYEGGASTYNSAAEAVEDLKKRGLIAEGNGEEGPAASVTLERLKKISWEKAKAKTPRNREEHRERMKQRLQEFRRDKDTA